MTNLHSNPLPATSCGLPASLQRSALSRACHAHNRVCYTDSRLMTQTVVFVIQIAVSICSVHRDLLCCRVCQHWLSPKESNRCENHPCGDPLPSPQPRPSQCCDWTGPAVLPTRNPVCRHFSLLRSPLAPALRRPHPIPEPPPSRPVLRVVGRNSHVDISPIHK
jgi:hypothetical protein